jgi:hypothetical protein
VTTAQEGTDLVVHPTDSIKGDPSCLEGSTGRADPGAAPMDNLSVPCQNHGQFRPGAGCLVCP